MENGQKKVINNRSVWLTAGIVLLFAVILVRFFYVQVVRHAHYAGIAQKQYERREFLPAGRGEIFDRNGNALVINRYVYEFGLYKPEMKNPRKIAEIFASATGKKDSYFMKRIKRKGKYVQLARQIDEEKAKKIIEENLSGIRYSYDYARVYPLNNTASHIIGFCGTDGSGLEGLERKYNDILEGKDGERFVFRDGFNNPLVRTDFPEIPPENGKNLILTLDLSYQSVMEEELAAIMKEHKARAAMGVLVDIHTGDVLAMASLPDFNPNKAGKFPKAYLRNRCITDVFDPGSIFKPITAAALLQEKKVHPGQRVFCNNGEIKIYNTVIHDHERFGYLTFEEILINSSNVGIIKLASALTKEKFYRYIRAFGFGEKTGIELAGEAKGILQLPSYWSGISQASMAMGHEIGVNALQMAMAYAVLANGGILYKPHIIYRVDDGKIRDVEKVRRVFSSRVTNLLTPILTEVVLEGTGKRAFLETTSIAGKTGTAQKFDSKKGRYSHKSFMASFAGYFPSHLPKYAMVILVDSPRRNGYYGGQVAAPAFKKIVQRIVGLPRQSVRITMNSDAKENDPLLYIPDLVGVPVADARKIFDSYGIEYEVQGDFPFVVRQYPVAGESIRRGDLEKMILICNNDYGKNFVMPDLKSKSLKEAVYLLKLNDLKVNATGFGKVVKQWPAAGKIINQSQLVRIKGEEG